MNETQMSPKFEGGALIIERVENGFILKWVSGRVHEGTPERMHIAREVYVARTLDELAGMIVSLLRQA